MIYRIPYYYKKFACIGGACEYTCCRDWRIPIDEESMERYLHTPGPFGKRLLSGIRLTERRFELKEDGCCAFLNADGLCDIYKEMGESHMSKACRRFPRHMEDYGEEKEEMLSLSCPEAARVILEDEYQGAWREGQTERQGSRPDDAALRAKLPYYKHVRCTMVCIVKNRSVCFFHRLAMLAAYAHDLEGHSRRGERHAKGLEVLTARYLSRTAPERFAQLLVPYETDSCEAMIRTNAWMREAQELFPAIPRWKAKQAAVCTRLYHKQTPQEYAAKKKEFEAAASGLEEAWENLVLYFINTYLLGAVYDDALYTRTKLVLFSFVIIREWCFFRYLVTGKAGKEELVEACVRYSREVENSDENLDSLEQILEKNRLFGLDSVLKVLCGTSGMDPET